MAKTHPRPPRDSSMPQPCPAVSPDHANATERRSLGAVRKCPIAGSLKIVGDFYLAKVYEATVHRLRIPLWQQSVQRKQQMLGNIYQLLKGEVDTARSLLLETTIMVLIVGEILLALVSWLGH